MRKIRATFRFLTGNKKNFMQFIPDFIHGGYVYLYDIDEISKVIIKFS